MKALKAIYRGMRTKVNEEKGATMIEYAMMVVAIALVAIVGAGLVGGELNTTFGGAIKTAVTAP